MMEEISNTPDWSTKTILIAEDMDDNFMVLSALLKKTNAILLHAHNGTEAVRMTRENPTIDIILMDISMPVMDGIEATRLIKQQFPDKVIVAQTAHSMSSQLEKMTLEGCNDIILKPIRKNLLIKILYKYLS